MQRILEEGGRRDACALFFNLLLYRNRGILAREEVPFFVLLALFVLVVDGCAAVYFFLEAKKKHMLPIRKQKLDTAIMYGKIPSPRLENALIPTKIKAIKQRTAAIRIMGAYFIKITAFQMVLCFDHT